MQLDFGPRETLLIDDATLIYPNFSGKGDKYNREGDRNFSVRIFDTEDYDALKAHKSRLGASWNVKSKPPRNEGDDPFMYLPVKVKFNGRGPEIWLISGDKKTRLDEESVSCLDYIDIERVDLDIRPYDDEVNGKPFRSAYLDKMYVTQVFDRYLDRYGN